MHALNFSVVAKLGAQQPHTRIHLLAAAPMMYAQSTAQNLATLARGALIVFGVPLQKVVTSVTDGAANVRAVCLSHIVLFLYTLFTAQMQRDLGICGRWCAAHRANLVASVGLARLTQLPPPKQRRAKYTFASDVSEAIVTQANKLCAILQTTYFKNLMRQEQDDEDEDITEFTTVCFYY